MNEEQILAEIDDAFRRLDEKMAVCRYKEGERIFYKLYYNSHNSVIRRKKWFVHKITFGDTYQIRIVSEDYDFDKREFIDLMPCALEKFDRTNSEHLVEADRSGRIYGIEVERFFKD